MDARPPLDERSEHARREAERARRFARDDADAAAAPRREAGALLTQPLRSQRPTELGDPSITCFEFQRNGRCHRGSACRFSHGRAPANAPSGSALPPPAAAGAASAATPIDDTPGTVVSADPSADPSADAGL